MYGFGRGFLGGNIAEHMFLIIDYQKKGGLSNSSARTYETEMAIVIQHLVRTHLSFCMDKRENVIERFAFFNTG